MSQCAHYLVEAHDTVLEVILTIKIEVLANAQADNLSVVKRPNRE